MENGSLPIFGVVEMREDRKGVGGVFHPGPPKAMLPNWEKKVERK